MPATPEKSSPDQIFAMLQEIAQRQREIFQQMKEIFQHLQDTYRQIQKAAETLRELGEEIELDIDILETAEEMEEGDQELEKNDNRLEALESLFTNPRRDLVEALADGLLLDLLGQRGIPVSTSAMTGHPYPGFDLLSYGKEEAVFIKVETTLRPDAVREFLETLEKAKTLLPEQISILHGAVAWRYANAGAEQMAREQGLLSIRGVGNAIRILNPPDFRPKIFQQ
uniref:Restriction endonuclease n=1 Tax=Candidatus Kentrum sp. MB TaxID=2138164 RepID=A0A450XUX2_9GAMM|nr:MAG: hypothetical protein BECKMB1821G_GA0114241_11365 [Candidatus Kentron sp. MB]VFK35744.1 MAG: hypothetical protein BECKMB1821I_GA0114274_11423 [Candidatus Kentron sp. MB]VFK77473.1 MAG: hypothetical protein BECKMB1821H_GA0114242_11445 [Candidatus Kentron sp. MB]